MKSSNHKQLSLSIALLISFIASSTLFLWLYFFQSFNVLFVIGFTLLIFATTYFFASYIFQEFIVEKIRLIYKNIHTFKIQKKENEAQYKIITKKSLDEVDVEVQEWIEGNKQEYEEMKKLEVYRREFLGNVSHELKTPITNIQGYVLTLLDGGIDDPNLAKDFLERTERNIDRMIEIINDLEEISRLESNILLLKPEAINIVNLTKTVVDLLETKAESFNIKLTFAEFYDTPILVWADVESIKKVLTNLIDNSIKYGNGNKGKTKISFFDMDEYILIEITDNGMGIAEEHIPRLFERFYRIDKNRSRNIGGSGLGLAIVKHIIEAHRQSINVRSTIGVGTTFAFTLMKAK